MKKLTAAETKTVRDSIAKAQGMKCALCDGDFREAKLVGRKLKPKLVQTLDHDHSTGMIRGVLCSNCNGLEGQIANRINRAKRNTSDLEWMQNYINYIASSRKNPSNMIYHTHKTQDQKRLLTNKRARNKRAAAKAAKILAGD